MKIFVSSLITGMETFRAAAREAIAQLGHEPIMAEDFGARAQSPQTACLDGLRQSALVILILGADYGAPQAAGISATHEEYRDAQGYRPVIAFVQQGVKPNADQAAFITEVQGWEGGLFRGEFRSPDDLRANITRAIHEWQLSHAAGPLDPAALLSRALAPLAQASDRLHRAQNVRLMVSIAAGPSQQILRPSDIERDAFAETLMQAALFGDRRLFSPSMTTVSNMESSTLVIRNGEGKIVLRLDPEGQIIFDYGIERSGFGMVVLEEDITALLQKTFRFANWLLNEIDPTQRLTHLAPALSLIGSDSVVWRTATEQAANPNSFILGWRQHERSPVHLTPAHRPRTALSLNAEELIEDYVTLLRREWRNAA